jgi:hypothetical protein
MLILTGSDDLNTRLAAGGVLAIVTESPHACAILVKEQERSVWSRMLSFMEYQEEEEDEEGNAIPVISSLPPDEPSILRAAVILFNLLEFVFRQDEETRTKELKRLEAAGIQDASMRVLHLKVGRDTLEPVVECLKLLKRCTA